MNEAQAAALIAQNNVIIALLHAQIIASGNVTAMAIGNAQMKIAERLAKQ